MAIVGMRDARTGGLGGVLGTCFTSSGCLSGDAERADTRKTPRKR